MFIIVTIRNLEISVNVTFIFTVEVATSATV